MVASRRRSLRACLDCGMSVASDTGVCLKCDGVLQEQTDGSVITEDIAHHGERIHEALDKLDRLIDQAKSGFTARICLITGSGLIREAVIGRLGDYLFRGDIKSFDPDGGNPGVIDIQLR